MYSFGKALLAIFIVCPATTWAQNLPIELKTSDDPVPPIMNSSYQIIGSWDVDDWVGNNATGISVLYSGVGTHQKGAPGTGGTYMAALGIDRSNLYLISELTTTVSDKSVESIRQLLLKSAPNTDVFYSKGNAGYIVGVWDVDGGGGYGNDGSFGKYAMTLTAQFSTQSSDRKLNDLFLVASNDKTPAKRNGYEVVGYWDVDNGGARGTDGSSGSYMMTLLAKWN